MGKAHVHLASAEVLIVEDEPLLRKRLAAKSSRLRGRSYYSGLFGRGAKLLGIFVL